MSENRAYAYQRVAEMPLVEGVELDDTSNVYMDFTKVFEKSYNGVWIEKAENAAKILNEEYMAKVDTCKEHPQYISVPCEIDPDDLKKRLNRIEAFVSSI